MGSIGDAFRVIASPHCAKDKRIADNLIQTYKRNILPQINFAVANPAEFEFDHFDYFDNVIDAFTKNNFDEANELLQLQLAIKNHKETARFAEMSLHDKLRYLSETMTDEEKKRLRDKLLTRGD